MPATEPNPAGVYFHVLHYSCKTMGAKVKYSDLVRNEVSAPEIQEFLANGEATAITIRIPKNLKDAAMEAANLKGVSFSAFVRMCMIDELKKGC